MLSPSLADSTCISFFLSLLYSPHFPHLKSKDCCNIFCVFPTKTSPSLCLSLSPPVSIFSLYLSHFLTLPLPQDFQLNYTFVYMSMVVPPRLILAFPPGPFDQTLQLRWFCDVSLSWTSWLVSIK